MDFSLAELKKAINYKLLPAARYGCQWKQLYHKRINLDDWLDGEPGPSTVDDWFIVFGSMKEILQETIEASQYPSDALVTHKCQLKCERDYDYSQYYLEFEIGHYETELQLLTRVYEEEVTLKLERAKKAEKKAADKKVDVELEVDALIIRASKNKKLKKLLAEKLSQLPD